MHLILSESVMRVTNGNDKTSRKGKGTLLMTFFSHFLFNSLICKFLVTFCYVTASSQRGWGLAHASSEIHEVSHHIFWTTAHTASQSSVIHSEEGTFCTFLYTWSPKWPWLSNLTMTDRGERESCLIPDNTVCFAFLLKIDMTHDIQIHNFQW